MHFSATPVTSTHTEAAEAPIHAGFARPGPSAARALIDQAISLVARRLNENLPRMYPPVEDGLVAVDPVTDSEGKLPASVRNKLAIFISDIAGDRMPRPGRVGFGEIRRAPPVHLDAYFMVAAAFEPYAYGEGLKLLASALRFFQANPALTAQKTPDMPKGLGQLGIEIANPGNDALGQLWGNFGGRYLPSVMYKLRSVPIDSDAVIDLPPLIHDPGGVAELAG